MSGTAVSVQLSQDVLENDGFVTSQGGLWSLGRSHHHYSNMLFDSVKASFSHQNIFYWYQKSSAV